MSCLVLVKSCKGCGIDGDPVDGVCTTCGGGPIVVRKQCRVTNRFIDHGVCPNCTGRKAEILKGIPIPTARPVKTKSFVPVDDYSDAEIETPWVLAARDVMGRGLFDDYSDAEIKTPVPTANSEHSIIHLTVFAAVVIFGMSAVFLLEFAIFDWYFGWKNFSVMVPVAALYGLLGLLFGVAGSRFKIARNLAATGAMQGALISWLGWWITCAIAVFLFIIFAEFQRKK